jgi:hypothetical protein
MKDFYRVIGNFDPAMRIAVCTTNRSMRLTLRRWPPVTPMEVGILAFA